MPLRTAMPPSEMKPTRLATVSVCPVSTSASTPPMNAVGRALRICRTIRTDGYSIISTTNMPTTDTRRQHGDQRRRPLLALELPAVLDEVALRAARPAACTRCLDVGDDAGQVAALRVAADDDPPAGVLAVDRVRPAALADVGQRRQLDLAAAVGQVDPQPAEVGVVGAVRLLQPDHQVEPPLPFEHLRDDFALQRRLHELGRRRPGVTP